MKKLIIACGVVAMGVFATSCKKEYTCTCTSYSEDGTEQASASTEFEKMKKDDAEDKCNEGDTEVPGFGKTECEIE